MSNDLDDPRRFPPISFSLRRGSSVFIIQTEIDKAFLHSTVNALSGMSFELVTRRVRHRHPQLCEIEMSKISSPKP